MAGTEVLMNQERILHWMLSHSLRRASKSSTRMTMVVVWDVGSRCRLGELFFGIIRCPFNPLSGLVRTTHLMGLMSERARSWSGQLI